MQGSVNPAAVAILAKLSLISGLASTAVVQVRCMSSLRPAASPMRRHGYCYTECFARTVLMRCMSCHACRAQVSFSRAGGPALYTIIDRGLVIVADKREGAHSCQRPLADARDAGAQ